MRRVRTPPVAPRELATRVRRLAALAAEAKTTDFGIPVTRLTVLKALCRDTDAAAHFLVHLAAASRDRLLHERRPQHLPEVDWRRDQGLATRAVERMERHLASPRKGDVAALRTCLDEVAGVQSETRDAPWTVVRIITDRPLLVVEYALEGLLAPEERPQWAYQAARAYTEEYDPRYGNGLIPASAPRLADIAEFWCRRLDGQPLRAWLASPKTAPAKAATHRPKGPTTPAATGPVDRAYPTLAAWVADGWIEIGRVEGRASFVAALDEGGLVWEGRRSYPSLDDALADLERGLARWLARDR